MVTDGITYHAGSPVIQRRILLIGLDTARAVILIEFPVFQIALGYECMTQSFMFLNFKSWKECTE